MKKIITGVLCCCLLAACKKEKVHEEKRLDPPVSGSLTVAAPEQPVTFKENKEFSPDQVTALLAEKDNDTIYITNFFATWCGPCMREIPHFKEEMKRLSGQPVKFTFVSLDEKTAWPTDVKNFTEEYGLQGKVVLTDGNLLDKAFFSKNFKSWDGSGIPFTHMRRRDKTDEYMSALTKEMLQSKIASFMPQTEPNSGAQQ